MTDGNTLIVDVVQSGDDYILNDSPVNMMIAYEVVRRHVTDNGTFYSQLVKKHKTSEGYEFVFDTGDTFTCASDTAFPTASSISDSTGGGSGGGLPPVTSSDNGKVLTVADGEWSVSNLDNADRRIIIEATLGNDGNLTTSTTISYGDARMLAGGCYLYLDVYDTNSMLIERIPMNPVCQHEAQYFFYEGQYFDIAASITERVVAGFAWPNGEDVHSTVYLLWKSDKFVVTLTPTALDYSGTMDKTVAEINAAYEAGQEIWFKVLTGASTFVEVPLTYSARDVSYDYNGFAANIVQVAADMLIVAYVGSTSDGTKQTYSTKVYTLTPAT